MKRKKQHEHTLEQTTAQISTLEQQIYSIEAANINRETLAAMERAGEAMQQIHGKLNIDKVDETMYVHPPTLACRRRIADLGTGRNFGNNMHLVKKLPVLLRVLLSVKLLTNRSWMSSLRNSNKNNLIIRCSRLVLFLFRMRSIDCQRYRMGKVRLQLHSTFRYHSSDVDTSQRQGARAC